MYTNAGFQSIGTTSDFRIKFTQNYVNDKTLEKINIKTVINIIATNVLLHQISVNLENFRFCPRTKFARKNMNDEPFEKINIKILFSI